ncbi:hypothetical protein RQP46_008253 [Phenoliferia psychrophenolica]
MPLQASIQLDPIRIQGEISPLIYSGFTEHMGRCIYGGIYEPDNKAGLIDEHGFRTDVLQALRDIKASPPDASDSYRWEDGIGPRASRPARLELAWLGIETNHFGTDEFMTWCDTLGTEPFICLNMGTGTLESALHWLEYMNGKVGTYWADQRATNGHPEPYGVKYVALGNEVWGPWQVGQATAIDYAKAAKQWGKALKLIDPSIKLVSCGKEGTDDWDLVVLMECFDVIDYHSLHLYTRGPQHEVNAMSPALAERGIRITREYINLARMAKDRGPPAYDWDGKPSTKDVGICFDEWNVWNPDIAPGVTGAEQTYTMSDALAVAAYLNIFIRTGTEIACLAQSVNVISPLMTSPTGMLKQTTFFAVELFARFMQGKALDVFVDCSSYVGTMGIDRPWSAHMCKDSFKWIDSTAALDENILTVAIINRHPQEAFDVALNLAGAREASPEVDVYELHDDNLMAVNTWESQPVQIKHSKAKYDGVATLKAGSLQLVRITLV